MAREPDCTQHFKTDQDIFWPKMFIFSKNWHFTVIKSETNHFGFYPNRTYK